MLNHKIQIHLLGLILFIFIAGVFGCNPPGTDNLKNKRPNILFAISDDQSFPYASVYGTKGVYTPAFDQVAKEGILFNNAFVAAPQCSPSRAAILTGKNIWQLEEAGTHYSYFPKKFTVFTDLLEKAGYQIGYTGKPWAPGNWKKAGWSRNPVGPSYNKKLLKEVPAKGISKIDYSGNFEDFYANKPEDKPFFFWYGGYEPHRPYEDGSCLKAGKKLTDAIVPSFLPDAEIIRGDILDYAFEIEWFDSHLGKMIKFLKEKGELENTIIVATSDNGMPFPSAKANIMEYGTHVPLAVCWPEKIKGNRIVNDLVSLIDLAPTFLEIAGIKNIPEMTGRSLSKILFSDKQGKVDAGRKYVLTGRERHSHARPDNLGYPSRAIRTRDYLYIRNFKPERWPAGNPPGYYDYDNSPSKLFLLEKKNEWPKQFNLAFSKRPAEQLYDIKKDPGCINNIAEDPAYLKIKKELSKILSDELKKQGDPRVTGNGDIFESYPRFGPMRDFPGFKKRGEYNPAFQK